jgi:citrate synthase
MTKEVCAHSDAGGAVTTPVRSAMKASDESPGEARAAGSDTSTANAPVYEGLAGVVIASTEICDVDGERGILSYRGYDIGELACHASFEEIIYLLWNGKLPTKSELQKLSGALAAERDIGNALWEILAHLPTSVDPMDALRTVVSALAACDPLGEACDDVHAAQALQLVAKFPTIVAYYYRHQQGLVRVRPNPELSHAANFLYMLHGSEPTATQASAMDLCMVLMAEHGFNASTFAARVTAATLADMASAITTAIGTLKGPLHGGANQRAMRMMREIGDVSNVERYIDDALARKQRIMGFGHRVYRKAADPRSAYLRRRLYELCAELGSFDLYELATTIADTVEAKKGLYPNVDFYAAPVLHLVGVPLELFVTVFAVSRIPGWTAHVMEQFANNRLIRPLATYVGPEDRRYQPIEERG